MVGNPDVQSYQMITTAPPPCGVSPNHTYNCTSFMSYLFPELIYCANVLNIADPARCEALNVKSDLFVGCEGRGLALDPDALHAHVHSEVVRTQEQAEETRKALARQATVAAVEEPGEEEQVHRDVADAVAHAADAFPRPQPAAAQGAASQHPVGQPGYGAERRPPTTRFRRLQRQPYGPADAP